MNFKQAKQTIRDYFRTAYSDNALAELLDYARAGKLRFHSCCCVAGFPLRPEGWAPAVDQAMGHHAEGLHILGAECAGGPVSDAFNRLYDYNYSAENDEVRDAKRRRIIIPMIKAEIRRRAHLMRVSEPAHAVAYMKG